MAKQPEQSAEEMRDLNHALAVFREKDKTFTSRYNYYDGNHQIKYSTERLRKAFEKFDVYFAENWCAVIVNAVLERIGIQGWTVEDNEAAQLELRNQWAKLQIQIDAADVHEATVVCGEGFIIAERDQDLGLFYNDPRMCHVFYEAANPKRKRAGAKVWKGEDGRFRIDLYYPDRISAFVARKEGKYPKDSREFEPLPRESGSNDFKEVPIFHFRIHRRRIVCDLTKDILSLQDAVNKLVADLMASSEFDTFKERIYITQQNISNLKRAPGMRTRLRPSPQGIQAADVKEFGGSDLKNFIAPLDRFANSMAVISRTPRHYFFSAGAGVSGDALIAMEAPLVAKAETYRESIGTTWQELGAFVAREMKINIPPEKIQISWKPSVTVQPLARAQEVLAYTQSNLPPLSALRIAGHGEDEIKKVEKDMQSGSDQLTADAKAALEEARNNPSTAQSAT
jgi:hypothetical protein